MNIGIDEKQLKAVVLDLNKILANEYLLYTKTLKCHWNVVGVNFGALHLFFRGQYEELLTMTDDVAERIRSLDQYPIATAAEFIRWGTIKEQPGINGTDLEIIQELTNDHETLIRQIRTTIEIITPFDTGTSNFLTDLMEKHEKMGWMLRSFLS